MSSKMREMKKKGERQGILFSFTSSSHALHVDGAALKCGIMTNPNNSNREAINSNKEVSALVDTGSLNLNLITSSTANWLIQAGAKQVKGERYWRLHTPCGKSSLLKTELDFCLVIYNQITNSNELVNITAVVIDDEMLPYDLVIGRPTIQKHKLLEGGKISLSGDKFQFEGYMDNKPT